MAKAGISGRICSARPVSTSTSTPATGFAPAISLSNSTCTRSAVIRLISPDISFIAARTRSAMRSSNWETKRAARNMRRGSSRKEISGVSGVSSTPATMSAKPPTGSWNRPVIRLGSSSASVNSTAMALTLKSRRIKSPSRVSPNSTTGLRESPS